SAPVPPPAATLMTPEVPAPEPARVTSARLPLVQPLAEPPPAAEVRNTWTRPEPVDPSVAPVAAPPARVRVPQAPPPLTDAPPAAPKSNARPAVLTGTHPCTVGDCHDLVLPPSARRQLGGAPVLYAVPGPDRTVLLYTPHELQRLAGQLDRSP